MRDLLEIAHALSIAGEDDVVYVILERRKRTPSSGYNWAWVAEAVIALHKESANETYGDNIRTYYFEPLASDWCKSSRGILSDYAPDAVLSLRSTYGNAFKTEPYETRLVLGSECEADEIYKRHESWTGEK